MWSGISGQQSTKSIISPKESTILVTPPTPLLSNPLSLHALELTSASFPFCQSSTGRLGQPLAGWATIARHWCSGRHRAVCRRGVVWYAPDEGDIRASGR